MLKMPLSGLFLRLEDNMADVFKSRMDTVCALFTHSDPPTAALCLKALFPTPKTRAAIQAGLVAAGATATGAGTPAGPAGVDV